MAEVAFTFLLRRLQDQLEKGLDRRAGEEVLKINNAIEDMSGFLNDADWRRERDQDVEDWVRRARGLAYLVEDMVDVYATRTAIFPPNIIHLLAICLTLAFPFVLSLIPGILLFLPTGESLLTRWLFLRRLRVIAGKICLVREEMPRFALELADKGGTISGGAASLLSLEGIVGMDDKVEEMEKWLTEDSERRVAVFVVGAVGTGKTTLAAKVYENTKNQFDCYAWAFISQPFKKKNVLMEMVKGFCESCSESVPIGIEAMDEKTLKDWISKYLAEKKYLLVLDDVRNRENWNEINDILPLQSGAKFVFTTRDAELPSMAHDMKTHVRNLERLPEDDSWTLFCRRAFSRTDHGEGCPAHLASIGRQILEKCEGLPISIVTVAALLSCKEPSIAEWERVLQQLDKHIGYQTGQDVFVSSGYADLSPVLKRCFLYCSLFPENYQIPRKKLIRLLVAEGFAEDIPGKTKEQAAECQLDQLVQRNMLQIAKFGIDAEVESYRMLRLLALFALHMSKKDDFCSFDDGSNGFDWNRFRRFSTQNAATFLNSDLHKSGKLRSLLFFRTNEDSQPLSKCKSIWRLRLLRVLDLHSIRMRALHSQVGGLVLLRYLGLRGTGIQKLPKSLRNLVDLETIDIRQTGVRCLPDLHKLQQLRHIYMEGSFMDRVVGLPRGIIWLSKLQTLAGAEVTEKLSDELGYLTRLQKLSIGKISQRFSEKLCSSINKMTLLCSLSIKCKYEEQFDMASLAPNIHLSKLRLGGQMKDVLKWASSLSSLCYLYLWDSKLREDPLSALQNLKKLVLLSLCNAYVGSHVCCNEEGFPSLKKLSILHSTELESAVIAEGSMPNLEKLFIGYCPKLEALPEGIKHLKALKVVQVMEMPSGFEDTAREGRFKVQHVSRLLRSLQS